jgi:hypothetical protein
VQVANIVLGVLYCLFGRTLDLRIDGQPVPAGLQAVLRMFAPAIVAFIQFRAWLHAPRD